MIERQQELIEFLMENDRSSLTDCCTYLQISKPTLKNDVEQVNEILALYNVQIMLEGNKLFFSDMNQASKLIKIMDSLIDLRTHQKMLVLLSITSEPISLQELSEQLFVSKSKMNLVVNKVHQQYPNLITSSYLGNTFHGDDIVRCDFFTNILFPYFKGIDFAKDFKTFNERQLSLSKYISQLEVIQLSEWVNTLTNSHKNLRKGDKTQLLLGSLFYKINYSDATLESVSEFLQKRYEWLDKSAIEINKYKLEKDICSILKTIDNLLGTIFIDDAELKIGLNEHLTRNYGKRFNGPMDQLEFLDIKNRFPLSYEAAVIFLEELMILYDITYSQQDLIYLAIHFQTSIEMKKKNEQKIKCIMITPYGLTSGKLVKNQLLNRFEELEIINILDNINELDSEELMNSIDLVLSLSFLTNLNKPVIYLPLVTTEKNFTEIESFIDLKKNEHRLNQLLDEAWITIMDEVDTEFELMQRINKYLYENGYVTKDYLTSMIEREKISTTSSRGIAVPHGKSKYVKQDKIVIVKLDKPVKWGETMIDWVFLLALSENSIKKMPATFPHFYRSIARKKFYLDLKKNDLNSKELRKKLKEYFRN